MRPGLVLRDGRTVAELAHAELSEPAVMNAMAHGDGDRKPEGGRLRSAWLPGRATARSSAAGAAPCSISRSRPTLPHRQTLNVNLTQVATIVIVAVGMTLVIATGGIDLSVGSLMAISGHWRR